MAVVDVEQLLQELSPDAPCGEDLEYDPLFGEVERAAEGKPEQQIGDNVIPAEDPNWREVREKSLELLSRSKDLRGAWQLTRALLHTEGFPGLADGLAVLQGLLDRYWEPVHPRLDPEDDNDPTMRVNIVGSPASQEFVRAVRRTPMVASRVLGQFGVYDIEVASGRESPVADEAPPDMASIDGAFREVDLDELTATADAVQRSIDAAQAIEGGLTEQVGAANSVDLAPLVSVLQAARSVLSEKLSLRGVGEAETAGGEVAAGGPGVTAGDITSREDVIRLLDRACGYFERHEPSSPVPLLLQRAKRLTTMGFMEIIRDMAPDGLRQAEEISGTKEES